MSIHSNGCTIDHAALQKRAEQIRDQVLREWQFLPRTQIEIQILCSQYNPPYYGAITWGYLSYRSFVMKLRCDTHDQLDYLVRHEMLEALLADYGDFVERLNLEDTLVGEHQRIRDDLIEHLLAIMVPELRPAPSVRC